MSGHGHGKLPEPPWLLALPRHAGLQLVELQAAQGGSGGIPGGGAPGQDARGEGTSWTGLLVLLDILTIVITNFIYAYMEPIICPTSKPPNSFKHEFLQTLVAKNSHKAVCCDSRPSTCLFTRLEEYSLVPAVFLTAQFLQKM